MRLDIALSNQYDFLSRNQISEYIKNGYVEVDGKTILKPAFEVDINSSLMLHKKDHYVGRGALKLKGFLQQVNIVIDGLKCLDIGSSTGGFTQVLLEYGAKSVSAVDVGTSQLHKNLTEDKRVYIYENQDIRTFPEDKFELITCDISFISVNLILEKIDTLATKYIVILFKPQFEVGKNIKRDKKGVIRDEFAIKQACKNFETQATSLGWKLIDSHESKILGKEGNREFFYLYCK